jgi:hypothetical protein
MVRDDLMFSRYWAYQFQYLSRKHIPKFDW